MYPFGTSYIDHKSSRKPLRSVGGERVYRERNKAEACPVECTCHPWRISCYCICLYNCKLRLATSNVVVTATSYPLSCEDLPVKILNDLSCCLVAYLSLSMCRHHYAQVTSTVCELTETPTVPLHQFVVRKEKSGTILMCESFHHLYRDDLTSLGRLSGHRSSPVRRQ